MSSLKRLGYQAVETNRLVRANLFLLVLLVAHDLDHAVNQPPRKLAVAVIAIGLLGVGATVVTLALALRRHVLAAPASVALGVGTVLGFTLVHLAPHWGVFSDPYWDFSLNAWSWLFLLLPMVAALGVAYVGVRGSFRLRRG